MNATPDERQQKAESAARTIFESYPPQATK
jgi:hypothetical protein